jgi:hypothetical protein
MLFCLLSLCRGVWGTPESIIGLPVSAISLIYIVDRIFESRCSCPILARAVNRKNSSKQDMGYLLCFPCCCTYANSNPITNESLHAHVLLSRPLRDSYFVKWFHYSAVSHEMFVNKFSYIKCSDDGELHSGLLSSGLCTASDILK